MENIKDDKEIIYLALSNQIIFVNKMLESNEMLTGEEADTYRYLSQRSLEILDKLSSEIIEEPDSEPIDRPKFH